jgi:hypothetical protein
LRTYLDAFASPRVTAREVSTGSTTDGERMPYPRRLGLAFCALLEHLDPQNLPHHGGDATTVIVTMTLDQLRAELATAGVGEAELANLSADEARRLACTAQIVPAVLGGDSEILDLGRTRRLFSPAQRKALRLRDQRCRAEGCTIPATWTEAHHLQSWHTGGPTDLTNAILLCSHHHHRAHDSGYDFERLADGDLRFYRRR